MADEAYWTYKGATPTPSLQEAIECGAISPATTDTKWHQLSPGMRRDIVRSHMRRAPNIDVQLANAHLDGVNPEGWREVDGVQLPPITWAK